MGCFVVGCKWLLGPINEAPGPLLVEDKKVSLLGGGHWLIAPSVMAADPVAELDGRSHGGNVALRRLSVAPNKLPAAELLERCHSAAGPRLCADAVPEVKRSCGCSRRPGLELGRKSSQALPRGPAPVAELAALEEHASA